MLLNRLIDIGSSCGMFLLDTYEKYIKGKV